MYVHVYANMHTSEHIQTHKQAFASRAHLKRCRQTCLHQQQFKFPTTSSCKFTAVSQETRTSLQISEQQPQANLVAPIPAQQRPVVKSMQGREERQIMNTSERSRVRSTKLDWFWTLSYKDQQSRTDGQTHLLEPEAPPRVGT